MCFSLWILVKSFKAIAIVQILLQFSKPVVLPLWDFMEYKSPSKKGKIGTVIGLPEFSFCQVKKKKNVYKDSTVIR